jgi:hypothetical protein
MSVFCLVFSTQVIWTIQQKSATFDEPVNLVSGYISLRFGDARLVPQNLPLIKLLAALPLWPQDLRLPAPPIPWSTHDQYRYASELLYEHNDAGTLLFLGRLTVLPLSLLLGCFIYLWCKQLFGRSPAALALFLYSFEPNILGHSGLITTDIATACFMFLTIFLWYQLAQCITVFRAAMAALTFGLCFLTKFTGLTLTFIGIFLMGVIVMGKRPLRLRRIGEGVILLERPVQKLGACFLLATLSLLFTWALIWAAYGFQYETEQYPVEAYHTQWRDFMPLVTPFFSAMVSQASDHHLLPAPYLYGLAFMVAITGYFPGYLMGEIRYGGWWYYFLVTLLIKTPLPLILLILWALIAQRAFWFGDPVRSAFLIAPIVIYFTAISASHWNIGHRHLFPIYPFLLTIAASILPRIWRGTAWHKAALALLLCWYLGGSIWIAPHYLAYFNELVGGPDNGHHYLADSNLDWGQDLIGLGKYMEDHKLDRVWLSYFGQADPLYYGIAFDYLPSHEIHHAEDGADPEILEAERLPLLCGTVAISATALQVSTYVITDPGRAINYFDLYRRIQPVAKIGYSIFIYQFDCPASPPKVPDG